MEVLEASNESPLVYLRRHVRLDRGTLDAHDYQANQNAPRDGSRILSAYNTKNGDRIWIITEATDDEGVRGSTCILLPEDY